MQWSNHCVPWQIDFVGVVFGLRPLFFVSGLLFWLFCCFLWRNASLAGGFAGRRGLVVLCVFFGFSTSICLLIWTNCVLVQTSFRQLMLM